MTFLIQNENILDFFLKKSNMQAENQNNKLPIIL